MKFVFQNHDENPIYQCKIIDRIVFELDHIRISDRLNIQKDYYSEYSRLLYKLLKIFGIPEGISEHYQYCPVAFYNHGGFWITASYQIENPFLVDSRKNCGRIVDNFV